MADFSNQNFNLSYGLNQPSVPVFQAPVSMRRDPAVTDKGPLGMVWINNAVVPNRAFILTSIVNNIAIWNNFFGGGTIFNFIQANVGIDVGGDIGAGAAGFVTLTNATNTTQGAGALSILSTNANPGNNAGFLKVYVGASTAWVPYFTNIAP